MDISIIVPFYKGNQYMEQLFGVVRRKHHERRVYEVALKL